MGIENSLMRDIEKMQLTCYGHVKRMPDTKLQMFYNENRHGREKGEDLNWSGKNQSTNP